MRQTIWATALILTVAASAPAFAAAGMPGLARLDVGPYQASLSGDSPKMHTGTNTITLAVPNLPSDATVSLQMIGPKGQVVEVPFRPLVVLAGPEGGHGGEAQGSAGHEKAQADTHGQTNDTHGQAKDAHGQASAPQGQAKDAHGQMSAPQGQAKDAHGASTDDHGTGDSHGAQADTAAYQVRGKAVLSQTGVWKAVLTIDGNKQEFDFDVVQGGPNRGYLGVTGFVMAGSLVYGVIERRRQQNRGV